MTLEELHSWILEAREVMYDEAHEDMIHASKIELVGEPEDPPKDVKKVQKQFRYILGEINKLDHLFHDKLDCR